MAKQIKCFFCNSPTPNASRNAKAVLCGTCVSKLVASPQAIGRAPKPVNVVKTPKVKKVKVTKAKVVSKATGFGRGWHLKKKFVAPDGTVYSFGQKV